MEYYTITTNAGDQAIAQAIQSGTTKTFKSIAVGDGSGTYYDPAKTQTALRHEVWRGDAVTAIDPNNTSRVISAVTIPASVGGFTIREAGIFDTSGTLMVIAKLPLSEKVSPDSGASSDLILRLYVEVGDADAITLTIDPSAIVATKLDVQTAGAQAENNLQVHARNQALHSTALSCSKTGTTYALTGLTATSGAVPVVFKVPASYAVGDTVTIDKDGTTSTAYLLKPFDGTTLTAGAWVTGAYIRAMADVDNKILWVWPSAPSGSVQGNTKAWIATAVVWDPTNLLYTLTIPGFVYSDGCTITFKAPAAPPGSSVSLHEWCSIVINSTYYFLRTIAGKSLSGAEWIANAEITVTLSPISLPLSTSSNRGTAFVGISNYAEFASGTQPLTTAALRNAMVSQSRASSFLGVGVVNLVVE